MDQYNVLSPESRVWVYQSDRILSDAETESVNAVIQNFVRDWTSHSRELNSYGKVVDNAFVVLMVDESKAGASGCSIDKSVHFIQQLGRKLEVDFMNRMNFAVKDNSGLKILNANAFKEAYKKGDISDDSTVIDTLIKTKRDFEAAFQKPLKESWHKRFV